MSDKDGLYLARDGRLIVEIFFPPIDSMLLNQSSNFRGWGLVKVCRSWLKPAQTVRKNFTLNPKIAITLRA